MALKYTGGGFLPGVPARDLSEDEVKEHGGERALLKSGLYEKESKKPGPKADKADRSPATEDKEE